MQIKLFETPVIFKNSGKNRAFSWSVQTNSGNGKKPLFHQWNEMSLCYAVVAMMQSTEDWCRNNPAVCRRVNFPRHWRVAI